MNGTLLCSGFAGRELWIYLPASYFCQTIDYPVVYVQDGGALFRDQLPVLEDRMRRRQLREVIFVGVKPLDRLKEYTPWLAQALRSDYPDFGGQGQAYVSFLVEQLKPYMDTTYRTLQGADHTGIAGASLGGLISMYAACLYPAVFGRIAVISGSFWFQGFLAFMQSAQFEIRGQRIYMDVGADEGNGKSNIQQNMVANNKQAYAILLQKGFQDEDCCLVIEEGAQHHGACFLRRFPYAMQWLFPSTTSRRPEPVRRKENA